MKWIPLELCYTAEISSQVDTVINTYTTLQNQLAQRKVSNPSQVTKALAVLRRSFTDRLEEMSVFYQENDLDSRSSVVEAARIKLKRFLRSVENSNISMESEVNASNLLSQQNLTQKSSSWKSNNEDIEESTTRRSEDENRETVKIRIVLTKEEYSEILARREALRQLKLDSALYNH